MGTTGDCMVYRICIYNMYICIYKYVYKYQVPSSSKFKNSPKIPTGEIPDNSTETPMTHLTRHLVIIDN
jgi:hypothetical protein